MGNLNSCYCAEHSLAADAIEAHDIHSHDLEYDVVTTDGRTKHTRQSRQNKQQPSSTDLDERQTHVVTPLDVYDGIVYTYPESEQDIAVATSLERKLAEPQDMNDNHLDKLPEHQTYSDFQGSGDSSDSSLNTSVEPLEALFSFLESPTVTESLKDLIYNAQGFYPFLTEEFAQTCWNCNKDIQTCIECVKHNADVLLDTGWPPLVHATKTLLPCFRSNFQMLIPFDNLDTDLLFVDCSKLNLSEIPCDLFQQCYFFIVHQMRRPLTVIVDFGSVSISTFRKISSREIQVARSFNGCAPILEFNVYILNAPWWIYLVKMLVPKRHLSKIRLVKKKQMEAFIDEIGPDLVPAHLGGNLEIEDRWKKQIQSWEKKAENIKLHDHTRQISNIYWFDSSV